ncbi:MAG: hypothetical protein DRN30_06850 [Thermoplasmata archaeon]|nr:MAG: hypothetical protein DRN30_06850 [Thermoplasmata archaeon]
MASPRFPNIPGVDVEIQDGNLKIPRPTRGPVVVLLGKTTSTQVRADGIRYAEPFEPYGLGIDPLDVANRFKNDDGTYSEVSKAILESYAAGAKDVVAVNIEASGISTDQQRYDALQEAYYNLQNFESIDIVVPVGTTIDASGLDSDKNFGYQLANFCYQVTRNNNEAIGILGTAPANTSGTPSLSDTNFWVNRLSSFDGVLSIYDGVTDVNVDDIPENYEFYGSNDEDHASLLNPTPVVRASAAQDQDGTPIDVGMYISVCAMDVNMYNAAAPRNPGFYTGNGASAYAGMVAALPSQEAPTNKIIAGVTIQKPLSKPQLQKLNRSRFVCLEQKDKGLVVSNAMTGAFNVNYYSRSDFVNLTSVRIVYDALELIRKVGDPFVGGPNNAARRNALDSAIDSALGSMVVAGAVQNYNYSIQSTPIDQILGYINVNLEIVPAFEVKKINVIVGLRASL